jgi:DNA polymerase-1
MTTTVVADIETDGLLHDMTRIWVLSIGDPRTDEITAYADQPGFPSLAEGFARLKAADRVVFHNGLAFDLFAINRIAPGTLRVDQVYDTLVVSRLVDPERRVHNLEDWGERLGIPKVEITEDEWKRWDPKLAERCNIDVKITKEVFKRMWAASKGWERAVELEHKTRVPVSLQEQHGFRIDVPAAQALEAELRQEQMDIERKLQEVFPPMWVARRGSAARYPRLDDLKDTIRVPKVGTPTGKGEYVKDAPFTPVELLEFNPGSRDHIEARLKLKYGWKPRKFTNSGAAQLDDNVLNELAVFYPEAKELARFFRVKKQLGQLADGEKAWLKLYRGEHPNARVHGSVNTNGAVTGRMSHFDPNLAQVDKKDLRMRAVWVPTLGMKQGGADAEGLELRMLGHYLAPYDGGDYWRSVVYGKKEEGTDVHSRAMKLLSFFDRDQTKREEYAYFYGAGNYKLGLIAIEDAQEKGKYNPDDAPWLFRPNGKPKDPAEIGKVNREKLESGIVGLDSLVERVKQKHKSPGYLIGLDGRRLYTRSAHSALNTLLQGAGAIVMKQALVIFHFEKAPAAGFVSSDFLMLRHGFAYLANVHDEVQAEAPPDLIEEAMKLFAQSITEAGERLNLRVPLAGSYQIGDNWKETH